MSYSERFIDDTAIPVPAVTQSVVDSFNERGLIYDNYLLNYSNYSVLQNPFRKFPFYTACNIDGGLFQNIKRKELFNGKGDKWAKDSRIPKEHQLGNELYNAERSDFDKGHLTKREDTQWGITREEAIKGAESTFYFTNAMPQVDRLNRGVWRKIEDYILHQEVVKNNLKIVLFTGPIFNESDPDFVTAVKDETVQLPYLFWKVVYYSNNGTLYRTGFLTSQKGLLEKRRIVKPMVRGDAEEVDLFMDFKDAETYQVRVDFIEKISGLRFCSASERYVSEKAEAMILEGIDVRSDEVESIALASINMIL